MSVTPLRHCRPTGGLRKTVLLLAMLVVPAAFAPSALGLPLSVFPYQILNVGGSPFEGGPYPIDQVQFSPNGQDLAVTSETGIDIQAIAPDTVVSAPTLAAGPDSCSGVSAGTGYIDSMSYSPDGTYLVEAESPAFTPTPATLRIYSVTGTALTNDSCVSLKSDTGLWSVAVGPAPLDLIAVTNSSTNKVYIYSVGAGGKLFYQYDLPTGKGPDSVAFGPSASGGEAMAVANSGDNTVSTYSLYGATVAPAPGSPVPVGKSPSAVAFSPTSDLLAVADSDSNQVSMFSVSYSGSLTAVTGSPFSTGSGSGPDSVAFGPHGGLLVTANGDANTASMFTVSSAGALTNAPDSPFNIRTGPNSIAINPTKSMLAVSYATDLPGSWSVYNYGQFLPIVSPKLSPWLSSVLERVLKSLRLGASAPRFDVVIARELKQIRWGKAGRRTAKVRLIKTVARQGRVLDGQCVAAAEANDNGPVCTRMIQVTVFSFLANRKTHSFRVLRQRVALRKGRAVFAVLTSAPNSRATPESLRVKVR